MVTYVAATREAASSTVAGADPSPVGTVHAIEPDGDVTACGVLVGELHVYRDQPWIGEAGSCTACQRVVADQH